MFWETNLCRVQIEESNLAVDSLVFTSFNENVDEHDKQ